MQHQNRLQALWLANISSVILFYPYLKASFLTPVKQVLGQTMEFKTTLKGGNNGGFNLRTFGPALIITILNIVTFSVGLATLDTNINAAKSISLCWIVFNTVPHLLLLLNGYFGPGLIMVCICKVSMFVTNASGILAIILMWLLYPREVKFVKPLAASITFMQARSRPCWHVGFQGDRLLTIQLSSLLCDLQPRLMLFDDAPKHIRNGMLGQNFTYAAPEN